MTALMTAEKPKIGKKQVGVRLSERAHRTAISLGLGSSVTKVCEDILEEELMKLVDEAERLAISFANGSLDLSEQDDERSSLGKCKQISPRISLGSYAVAQALAFKAGSVPKVCEPILERVLQERLDEETKANRDLIRRIRENKQQVNSSV